MENSYKELISGRYSDWSKSAVEQGFKLIEHFDKIITWLISLSTGSIVLIFSSYEKLTFVSRDTINTTLAFLFISILLGLLGRVIYAAAVYFGYHLTVSLGLQYRLFDLPIQPREITESDTASDIYHYFQEDFKLDKPELLDYKLHPEKSWPEYHSKARELYEFYAEINSSFILQSLEKIGNITLENFGLPEDYIEKNRILSNKTKGKIGRITTALSYWLYFLSTAAFGTAITYFCVEFFFSK